MCSKTELLHFNLFSSSVLQVSSSEIARLALLFSPNTLETVALLHFQISEATVRSMKASHREDIEAMKRELLYIFRNKGGSRKVVKSVESSILKICLLAVFNSIKQNKIKVCNL